MFNLKQAVKEYKDTWRWLQIFSLGDPDVLFEVVKTDKRSIVRIEGSDNTKILVLCMDKTQKKLEEGDYVYSFKDGYLVDSLKDSLKQFEEIEQIRANNLWHTITEKDFQRLKNQLIFFWDKDIKELTNE